MTASQVLVMDVGEEKQKEGGSSEAALTGIRRTLGVGLGRTLDTRFSIC